MVASKMTWITQLQQLATQLPSGLTDSRSLEKLYHERQEQFEATDQVDRSLEGGDRCYYAAKAVANGLMTEAEAEDELDQAAEFSGISRDKQIAVAILKYALRARPGNPKNHGEESRAVGAIL